MIAVTRGNSGEGTNERGLVRLLCLIAGASLLVWVIFGLAVPQLVNAFVIQEQQKLIASDAAVGNHFGGSVAVSGDTAVIGTSDDSGSSNSESAYVFRYNGSTWVEEAKLTASDAAAYDYFGGSVAISGDTAVIGAYGDDDRGGLSGSAYVFRYNGSTWVEEAKLTASDAAAGDIFGWSVAISGDTAVIGAYGDDDAGSSSGSAYVFRYNGSTWVEEAKLTASDAAAGDAFGLSVAISGDTAVIGAWRDNDGGYDSGSAYVFRYNGSTWVEEAKLTASDAAAYDEFGVSIAISGDTAVIGAWRDNDGGYDSGSAYVFRYNGSTWVEEAKLTASDAAAQDYFGRSVAISGDTAVMGAYWNYDVAFESGSAYVFRYNGNTWVEGAKLTASDAAAGDFFGLSVAISGDTAVIGADGDDDAGSSSGSAYVFSIPQKLTASDGATDDRFGNSVAIQGDTILIGASHDDDQDRDSGSAYIFRFNSSARQWEEEHKFANPDGAEFDFFGNSVAIDGDTAFIGAPGADGVVNSPGATYVFQFNPSTGQWEEQQKLTASDGAVGDDFGISVAIYGDTAVIGAYYDDDNGTNSGSAYVFQFNSATGQWEEQQKLIASDGVRLDQFGWSVAIDRYTVVIGAHRDNTVVFGADSGSYVGGIDSGSAYVFQFNCTTGQWEQQQKLTASDGAVEDFFGVSVAIYGDTAVIGAYYDDDNGDNSGSAYVFQFDSETGQWEEKQKLSATDGSAWDLFGRSVAIDGHTTIIGAAGADGGVVNAGATYVFRFNSSSGQWLENDKLFAADGSANDLFGNSVAIKGDTAIIGAQYDDDNGTNSGSAYVFSIPSSADSGEDVPFNFPPTTDAGPDQTTILGDEIQLEGSATDPECDTIVSWQWTIESAPVGSAASLSNPTVPDPTFIPDAIGDFVFSLVVSDGENTSVPDTVTIHVHPGARVYVSTNGSDSNNGTSWDDALQSIQRAIDVALPDTEIWVEEGTYYPSSVMEVNTDLAIYGGFDGTETERHQRDWKNNETVVDGTSSNDRCFRVHADAIIDGLSITGGSSSDGGGMYIALNRSPLVTNCTFYGNSASGYGGAISIVGDYPDGSNAIIKNCIFYGNSANYGGAIYNSGSIASPTIVNCTFYANSATTDGGAIYNSISTLHITNCSFYGNSAGSSGGAISNLSDAYTIPTVTNCILWGNTALNNPQIYDLISSLTVSYSDVQMEVAGEVYPGTENIHDDPLFVDPNNGDLHLKAGSPCIDKGTDSAPGLSALDFEGDSRKVDGDEDGTDTVDMGADEYWLSDQDGDGIEDQVDMQPTVSSNDFSDGTTTGSIINHGDQNLVITDEPDSDGIRITADSTGGPGAATVSICGGIATLTFSAGDEVVVTCGSASAEVMVGPIEILLSDDIVVTVPSETTVTVTEVADGQFEIKNSQESTAIVQIVVAFKEPPIKLNPGESVSVSTNESPVAICQDVTVSAGANCQAAADVDNGSYDPDGTLSSVVTSPVGPYSLGENPVILTVTDDNGDSDSCTAAVTVIDTTAPILSVPADATLECDEDTSPAATGQATATDNCGALTVAFSDAIAATCGNTKVITRTWTATDGSGNSSAGVQTITVVDTTPPILSVPADVTLECPADTSPAATGSATASDTCGDVTVSFDEVSLPGPGNTEVIKRTWTATDQCGNGVNATQTITVEDTTAPLAICKDISIELNADGSASITAADIDNGSSDTCGGVSFILTKEIFTCADVGANTVTLTVTDDSGNISTCDATVTVVETAAPEVTAALIPVSGDDDALFRVQFSATDNCDGSLTVEAFIKACSKSKPVTNGQIVKIERDDDCEIEWDDGMLEIEAPKAVLIVKARDSSGNAGKEKAVVRPRVKADGDRHEKRIKWFKRFRQRLRYWLSRFLKKHKD